MSLMVNARPHPGDEARYPNPVSCFRCYSQPEYSRWPRAGRLLTQPIQRQLIVEHWDDLLRLAGSLKFGHATASLVLRRLHAARRHGSLARAVVEYGRLVRTIFVLRYLADIQLRRRIGRQLNKGETLHSLRRRLFFAHEGHVRHSRHDRQTEQALCLTILTNAVVLWNTVYIADALEELRRGADIDDEAAAHLSPALMDHINPFGRYSFDVDRELARTTRRPLRRPRASA
jgi:TnpA family transposase